MISSNASMPSNHLTWVCEQAVYIAKWPSQDVNKRNGQGWCRVVSQLHEMQQ